MDWLRKLLLAVSLAGALISGVGLAAMFLGQDRLEDESRETIIAGVEQEIRDFMTPRPVEGEGKLAALHNKFVKKAGEIAEQILGDDYAQRIRERLADICVCRMDASEHAEVLRRYDWAIANVETLFENIIAGKLSETRMEPGTLDALADGYYVNTVEGLVGELRIFFGLNFVLFGLAAVASHFVGMRRRLFIPVGLLVASTIWTAGLYIFDQNWLVTILFNGWSGYGYLVLVGLNFLILSLELYRIRQLIQRAGA